MRAVDALCGVLSAGPVEPARQIIASRALAAIEQELFPFTSDEELQEAADATVLATESGSWTGDVAVRAWLSDVLHEHADDYNACMDDEDRIDAADHPLWPLLDLAPLARRLRLFQAATGKSAAQLASGLGVGSQKVRHWVAGRSLPAQAERAGLAAQLGIHPGWLAPDRDLQPDIQLYRARVCLCGDGGSWTRGSLDPNEPQWFDSAAEMDAAVRWCEGCGQPWLRDQDGWLLPLPPGGEDEVPAELLPHGPSVAERDFDEPWPPAVWKAPYPPSKRPKNRTVVFPVPAVLTVPPQDPSEQAPPQQPPRPRGYIPPQHRVAAYAGWCRRCRELIHAPQTPPGGDWILLHRTSRDRSLSTWTYPTEADAHHAAAHFAMSWQAEGGEDDALIADLFADGAYAQVLARFLELYPETDQFEVWELVPMRADEF